MATKWEVLALHEKQPYLTVREVADKLDCSPEYVRRTCFRNDIRFAPARGPRNTVPGSNGEFLDLLKAGMRLSIDYHDGQARVVIQTPKRSKVMHTDALLTALRLLPHRWEHLDDFEEAEA